MAEDEKTATPGTSQDTDRTETEEAAPEKLSITMDKRIDLAVIVAVIVLGVFIVIESTDIRRGSFPDPIGSRGMGYLVGTFLIIAGIILTVLRLVTWSRLPGNFVPNEGYLDEEGHPTSAARAFGIVLAGFIWVWLLKAVGYLILTPLFLAVVIFLLGVRERLKLIVFPLIFTAVAWTLFSQVLKIMLPLGPLGPFFHSLGLAPW